MKYFAERTCTVVHEPGSESSGASEAESRPLESFREETAYVLIGPPGSGKTEAFKREAQEDGGHYVTARDFLTLNTERQAGTLYIDGLDEVRAAKELVLCCAPARAAGG